MPGEGKSIVEFCWFFARENGALAGLVTIKLNGSFGNASKIFVAGVHAWVLSHSGSGSIRTSPSLSVVTDIISADPGGTLIFLAICVRHGAWSSFKGITSCALSLPVPLLFWRISNGKYRYSLGIIRNYLSFVIRAALYKPISEWGLE